MHLQRLLTSLGILTVCGLGNPLAQQPVRVATPASDVKPSVTNLTVSGTAVTDLHLRPLFTTTIRLPNPLHRLLWERRRCSKLSIRRKSLALSS
jgi:hypothetical protein